MNAEKNAFEFQRKRERAFWRRTAFCVSSLLLLTTHTQKTFCGERGIRTPGTLSGTLAFQASPFNHSGISPFPVFGNPTFGNQSCQRYKK